MSFEALLGKIQEAATLNKALPAQTNDDDKKPPIKPGDAAQDGETSDNVSEEEQEENDDDEDNDNLPNDNDPLVKSFLLKLEDGTDMEAFDGTELVKSLTLRLNAAETALKQNEAQVLKSLNGAVDLISAQSVQLKEQGALIKSLQDKVTQLAKTGRGRTSTLIVSEKPQLEPVQKSQPTAMSGEELIVKALGAMKAGRISGLEASGIENRVRMGIAIDPDMIARVCG